jgi:hypothetical protein
MNVGKCRKCGNNDDVGHYGSVWNCGKVDEEKRTLNGGGKFGVCGSVEKPSEKGTKDSGKGRIPKRGFGEEISGLGNRGNPGQGEDSAQL